MEICEVYGGMLVYDRCYVGMWYVGMVIGIENVDVFVNILVKVKNKLKNKQ
jgi:hypothetical protein